MIEGFFSAADLHGLPVPARRWLVTDLVPAGTVTLLSGDGGTGKSLLALQLAWAVATGSPWLGRSAETGDAIFISAEDDRDELHRRLIRIAGDEGLSGARRLTLRSLVSEDALFATPERNGTLKRTPLFVDVCRQARDIGPRLIVLDTLADLFGGNENDRAQARQFVGLLRGLAARRDCAVLLLSHPSLSGLSSGSGTSGSTGWSNSVRSRLYLRRVQDDGQEPDPNLRRLEVKKSNYAAAGAELALRWRDGRFEVEGGEASLDRMAAQAKAERVFLRLLRDFNAEGRRVRHTTGDGYAPTAFAKSGRSEGLGRDVLRSAMESLFARKVIEAAQEGPPSRRTAYLREVAE